mgnify:CR=1 FL=1
MERRKKTVANKRKEEKKALYFATLQDCPTSPRKMRTVVDLIRGQEVFKALGILKFNTRVGSSGSLFKPRSLRRSSASSLVKPCSLE